MRDINRRINTIEKRLDIGQHRKPNLPTIVLCLPSERKTTIDPDSLGPAQTWLTYQEQLQAAEKANAEELQRDPFALPKIITIVLDADKEVQARKAKDSYGLSKKPN